MNTLFVSWQDPEKRRWYPVGKLTHEKTVYRFFYTAGAKEAENFSPFLGMPQLDGIYESKDLFPIFSNRLLSESRPEYLKLIDWLSLDTKDIDPFTILSLTGGLRKTDSVEIFPCPAPTAKGNYELKFFSRGLSHQPEGTQKRVDKLEQGEKLYLMKDVQNPYDMDALVLRTGDPVTIVGYCPRYLTADLNHLLENNGPKNLEIVVDKVNLDAPYQLRLLCKITSPWPKGFSACSSQLYRPLSVVSNGESDCEIF